MLAKALRMQKLASTQSVVLRELQRMSLSEETGSFEAMAEHASRVDSANGANSLLFLSEQWKDRNPEASQLMALLYLFTRQSPTGARFNLPALLPPAWPRALAHLKTRCFDARQKWTRENPKKHEALMALMEARYGNR